MKRILYLAFPLLLIAFSVPAQIISTIAGGGTANPGDGGLAVDCELKNPIGVAVDALGNVFISDTYNNRVRKINTAGLMTTIAGVGVAGFSGDGGPATDAKIYGPYGLYVDNAGGVFFTDNGNDRVRKIEVDGTITTVAGGGMGGLGDGGSATDAMLHGPAGVVVDSDGNIYISDGANNRVRKVDAAGIITTIAGGGVSMASGIPATDASLGVVYSIAQDGLGNIFVGEQNKCRVLKIMPSGMLEVVAGTGSAGTSGDNIPATAAQLSGIYGVAVDGLGNIYLTDGNNNRIRKVNTSGIISTIAGTGTPGYSGDGGVATSAQLSRPTGIALSTSGNLYIADFQNDRIREVNNVVSVRESAISKAEIHVFPNPNSGNFTVEISSDFYASEKSVVITDMLGRRVYERPLPPTQKLGVQFNATHGVYVITVRSPQGIVATSKIEVIQ